MIKVNQAKKSIELTRGDSAYLTLGLNDNDGNPYELQDGDIVRVQVRTAPNVGELLFEGQIDVVDGAVVWHIRPADTSGKEVKTYYWDAQLETSNGDIFTFIPSSIFRLTDEVTMYE